MGCKGSHESTWTRIAAAGLTENRMMTDMSEVLFEVTQESDGGYCAECLTENIVTQADTWEELRANVRDAVNAYFFDQPEERQIRLRLVRDEVLSVA